MAQAPAAAPDPLVSILVVSYNTRAMTLECLASVIAETRVPYELIVLDNASPDGSAAAIAAEFPDVRLIASRENHGFAKGNNHAAREACGRYLLLLNPDTLVLDGAIDRLVAFAGRTPQAGIWGGRTLKGDRSLDPVCAFGDQTLWSLFCRTSGLARIFAGSAVFNPELYGSWARDSEREVGVIQGCFLLVERRLWDSLGGFDPVFGTYGEETDFCRRARNSGARPRLTPEAEIIHYGGASSKHQADKQILILKARMTLARRHLPAWQQPAAGFLLRMWPFSRMLGARLLAPLHPGAAEAAAYWSTVWRRRDEWRDGVEGNVPRAEHSGGVAGTAGE
ncbi:MAG: glycosyltransferase family 2 protein [Rhodobacteraceae bacterium]|nr:glycosyltransferase family 2 protein [Paracoccaceae bacterium]